MHHQQHHRDLPKFMQHSTDKVVLKVFSFRLKCTVKNKIQMYRLTCLTHISTLVLDLSESKVGKYVWINCKHRCQDKKQFTFKELNMLVLNWLYPWHSQCNLLSCMYLSRCLQTSSFSVFIQVKRTATYNSSF